MPFAERLLGRPQAAGPVRALPVVESSVLAYPCGVLFQGPFFEDAGLPADGSVPPLDLALRGRLADLAHDVIHTPFRTEFVETRVPSVACAPLCAVIGQDPLRYAVAHEAILQDADDVLRRRVYGWVGRKNVPRFIIDHGQVLHLHSGNAVEPQLHVVDLPHVVDMRHLEAPVDLARPHRDVLVPVPLEDAVDGLGGCAHPCDDAYLGRSEVWMLRLGIEDPGADGILDHGVLALPGSTPLAFHEILHALLLRIIGHADASTPVMPGVEAQVAYVGDMRMGAVKLSSHLAQRRPFCIRFPVQIDEALKDTVPFGLDLLLIFKSAFLIAVMGLVHMSSNLDEPLSDKLQFRAKIASSRGIPRSYAIFANQFILASL